jgi:subtilase family serine protease
MDRNSQRYWFYRSVAAILVSGVLDAHAVAQPTGLPASAQARNPVDITFGGMPPQGYARPPFHIRPAVTSTTPSGLTPLQVRTAYGFSQISNQGAGQTIAIVDAYDDPNIEADLGVFDATFGLPACTTANGCFQKIYAAGRKPRADAGWALEMSLDVEWAHAIAPQAKIILVEAKSSSFSDLLKAVDVAVKNGASAVSMSFGGTEFSSETSYDAHFNRTGVTFTASSGDSGNGVEYPSASPYVLAVGGTTLHVDSIGNYLGETAWSGSGGGVSAYEPEPSYQSFYPIPIAGKRGAPDVAYDGDPGTGFPVYDSVTFSGQSGWFQVGGTSAGAPQWAAMIAIANSMRKSAGKASLNGTNTVAYAVAQLNYGGNYNDVTVGTNGTCGLVCTAAGGYDYVTGLGTPQANNIITALVNQP